MADKGLKIDSNKRYLVQQLGKFSPDKPMEQTLFSRLKDADKFVRDNLNHPSMEGSPDIFYRILDLEIGGFVIDLGPMEDS